MNLSGRALAVIIQQHQWQHGQWNKPLPAVLDSPQTVAFVFFGPDMQMDEPLRLLRTALPQSHVIGCSGAGEIANDELMDETVVVTIVKFEKSTVASLSVPLANASDSFAAGQKLAQRIERSHLKAVYIVCEGLAINATELLRGIYSILPHDTIIAGGLAGDGPRFAKTVVIDNTGAGPGRVSALAFYGEFLTVVTRGDAGWLPFGPERKITKSAGNILYELDGEPALALYKKFLGKSAEKLPAAALMFPLLLDPKKDAASRNTVRTILGVDTGAQSMTFAGDMPEGAHVRFMLVNDGSLVAAARNCAALCAGQIAPQAPVLSLMVSCVGRRLAMGGATEDEIEAVFAKLPPGSIQAGFYSYGELGPGNHGACDLHNQTITLTWMQEWKDVKS